MGAAIPEQPSPELPAPIRPAPSPFWPQHLVDLLFRPTRFFTEQLALGRTPYVILVTWVLGMSTAVDRIDTRLMQAEISGDLEQWQRIEALVGTWPKFWAFVLGVGLLSGALQWWIGGWWCRVRLGWSGAESPDKRTARLLLIYSSFVFAGPSIVLLLALTATHPSYLAAFQSESLVAALLVVMVFWSLVTTYKGALALFPVSPRRARFWFVALPAVAYFMMMGGIGWLYARGS